MAPRLMSLVKDITDDATRCNGTFLYMGEIPNLPGHGVYWNVDDRELFVGLQTERFIELTEEEV